LEQKLQSKYAKLFESPASSEWDDGFIASDWRGMALRCDVILVLQKLTVRTIGTRRCIAGNLWVKVVLETHAVVNISRIC
jgi:hypothetical protein